MPHFLQRRVRFSRKEILGIVEQVGPELGAGFGGEVIPTPLKADPKEGSVMVGNASSWESGTSGLWAQLGHLAALWSWRVTLSDHTPPSNSVHILFKLPVFDPAL